MLPVDAYVPQNRDELIRRMSEVVKDLVGLRGEFKQATSAERMKRHMAVQNATQSGVRTQNRLDAIAREESYPEWDAVQDVTAAIKIKEEERDWLRILLEMP